MRSSNLLFALMLAALTGCTASTNSSPLSDYPDDITGVLIKPLVNVSKGTNLP